MIAKTYTSINMNHLSQKMAILDRLDLSAESTTAAVANNSTIAQVFTLARTKSVVNARRAVAKLLRSKGLSYPEIGAILDRDHTTIMSLVKSEPATYERRPRVEMHVRVAV